MKKWGTLIAMALSMFIIVVDTTIMNVSISALVEDLNTTVTGEPPTADCPFEARCTCSSYSPSIINSRLLSAT